MAPREYLDKQSPSVFRAPAGPRPSKISQLTWAAINTGEPA